MQISLFLKLALSCTRIVFCGFVQKSSADLSLQINDLGLIYSLLLLVSILKEAIFQIILAILILDIRLFQTTCIVALSDFEIISTSAVLYS